MIDRLVKKICSIDANECWHKHGRGQWLQWLCWAWTSAASCKYARPHVYVHYCVYMCTARIFNVV